jgi:DNA replication and repair protein RecF
LEALYLSNFRSWENLEVNFSSNSNLILGSNGAGKSNILEAICLLATSRSFRNALDQKMVQWGKDGYLVKGIFSSESGRQDIAIEYAGGSKNLFVNGVQERKLSSIIGIVYCVLFSFEDIYLIAGSPSARRGFLDLILCTVDQLYLRNLRTYVNVIRQKNRYLKNSFEIDQNLLSAWNEQLIPTGAYLIQKRTSLIDFINSYVVYVVKSLGEDLIFPFRLAYRTNITTGDDQENALRVALEEKMEKEARFRTSLFGPHRDDFRFSDGKHEIRHFGSVGEARLASILLKLAQGEFYRETRGVIPILLIDDILLELDVGNMENVLSLIMAGGQRIITTTERRKLPEIFSCEKVFKVDKCGEVSELLCTF